MVTILGRPFGRTEPLLHHDVMVLSDMFGYSFTICELLPGTADKMVVMDNEKNCEESIVQ
jgi:hypothetical protein